MEILIEAQAIMQDKRRDAECIQLIRQVQRSRGAMNFALIKGLLVPVFLMFLKKLVMRMG